VIQGPNNNKASIVSDTKKHQYWLLWGKKRGLDIYNKYANKSSLTFIILCMKMNGIGVPYHRESMLLPISVKKLCCILCAYGSPTVIIISIWEDIL